MNTFESLEQMYLRLAEEYEQKGDKFAAAYYRHAAFEASCLGE